MIRLPTELNEVIKQGGAVLVPSRQRAHAARLAYAAAELAQGRRVWATPDILTVDAWFTRAVERHAASAGTDIPRILSPAEEWFLWRQCAAEATGELELVNRGALAEALRRASATAADFGIDIRGVRRPELSVSEDRDAPGTETALLAEVQRAVDERCQMLGAVTIASLVARIPHCEQQAVASGFLTLPPRLRLFVSSSGEGGRAAPVVPNVVIAADELDELERIAHWCRERVARSPDVRILIALPGAPGTRERLATLIRQAVNPADVFQSSPSATADGLVVIEGGAPLARVPAVAHALSILSWLGGNAGDFEAVSAWLRAPYWQTPAAVARARLDLWLRERERMRFNLHQLVGALSSAPSALAPAAREVSTLINKATVALGQGSA